MLVAESLDPVRTAADHVADDAATGLARELVDHGSRKALGKGRECLFQMDSRDFPVAGCAVLACGRGTHAPPRANGVTSPLYPIEWLDVPETEALQSRQLHASRSA